MFNKLEYYYFGKFYMDLKFIFVVINYLNIIFVNKEKEELLDFLCIILIVINFRVIVKMV